MSPDFRTHAAEFWRIRLPERSHKGPKNALVVKLHSRDSWFRWCRESCKIDTRSVASGRKKLNLYLSFHKELKPMKTSRTLLASIVILSAMMAMNQTSIAQTVPFKASGSDAIYNTTTAETSGPGKAAHMGNMFGAGLAIPGGPVDEVNSPGLFYWTAVGYSMTASNGDQIFFNGGGTVQFIPIGGSTYFAVWSGDFNVDGGTGRFSKVGPGAEPIAVVATNDPFELDANGAPLPGAVWTYSWTLDGEINLGAKN
jgi:hypothetical protein